MADDFAKNRKRKALANALVSKTWPRDKSTGGKASAAPQAMNRGDKARDKAHDRYWNKRGVKADMEWTPNPSATIDKKSKVQYGQAR